VAPTTVNSSVRTREYLTTAEIERLMAAAQRSSRYGHRDATMMLIGYRHGLSRSAAGGNSDYEMRLRMVEGASSADADGPGDPRRHLAAVSFLGPASRK